MIVYFDTSALVPIIIEEPTHALRSYDAMHLASALLIKDSDVVMAAGDQKLLEAARFMGIATSKLATR